MHFNFITIFPNLVLPYFADSILKRALTRGLFGVSCFNPRDFSSEPHRKTDDYMCGGGAGLLMTPQPLFETHEHIVKTQGKTHTVALTPSGKLFRQNDAKRLSRLPNLTFVCGRYEGFDERFVEEKVDEVFCVGDFVLTGGELAALCVCDAICRNIDGVLGNENSLDEESFEGGLLEAPSFTKPNVFREFRVVSAFLKGNHANISSLKSQMAVCKTAFHRPDLFANLPTKIKESHEKQIH